MKISHKWDFGNDKKLAEKLKQLVLSGKKKATMGIYHDEDKVSEIGDCEAILDSNNNIFCIIRCTNVEIKSFLEVGYDFIKKEGEEDKGIEEWRKKHRKFFDLKDDNARVVCVEFEVIAQTKKQIKGILKLK